MVSNGGEQALFAEWDKSGYCIRIMGSSHYLQSGRSYCLEYVREHALFTEWDKPCYQYHIPIVLSTGVNMDKMVQMIRGSDHGLYRADFRIVQFFCTIRNLDVISVQ